VRQRRAADDRNRRSVFGELPCESFDAFRSHAGALRNFLRRVFR
jgi:hypothetical protein